MKVMFLRPVRGYAYVKGGVGDLSDEAAAELVARGAATPYEGEDSCTLPEGMPARKLLHEWGYRTVAEVRAARDTLTEIPGVGERMAENIVKYCEDYEEGVAEKG